MIFYKVRLKTEWSKFKKGMQNMWGRLAGAPLYNPIRIGYLNAEKDLNHASDQ